MEHKEARAQLINVVLMSLHSYWGQVFVLPKIILEKVNKICRSFFMEWSHLLSETRVCSLGEPVLERAVED